MALRALDIATEQTQAEVIEFPTKKTSNNKKKGKKSEVYAFEIEDMKNIINYFESRKMWIHYLLFVMGCNMARRIGDTLSLTWEHIYNPETGLIRQDILEIAEDKTDKLANPRINSACKLAVEKYVNETGCDVSANNYHNPVFMQLSGTHKGTVMTDSGYRKALKKAAVACGVTYNVGTHSPRKTFGKMSRMLHPNDYDSMELLQTIYNHSDTKTTKHYIGLTKEKIDQYYDDMGDMFNDYVTGDKVFENETGKPVVNIEISDLRDIIQMAYFKDRAGVDAQKAVESINEIMAIVDTLIK